ncbi:hypothetical protein NKH18_18880 [Streptomyces sp. M10(2022)]
MRDATQVELVRHRLGQAHQPVADDERAVFGTPGQAPLTRSCISRRAVVRWTSSFAATSVGR